MVYLVIIVVVAAAGILRLWLEQRREQSQLDSIAGFSSTLEAIKPRFTRSRVRGSAPRARRPRSSLAGWLTAGPRPEGDRRSVARRRIEARRAVGRHELTAGSPTRTGSSRRGA